MTHTMLFDRSIEAIGIGWSSAEVLPIGMTIGGLVLREKPFRGR